MKPGSSGRCKSKYDHLRCHLHADHSGPHQAPQGKETTRWG